MILRLKDCLIDTDTYEIRRGDSVRSLEPQVFDLLILLIENRHRLVSKHEIIERIWNGRAVSDAALSSRIKSARQALGDSGASQELIRTVRGRGFRFVAEVSATDEAATSRRGVGWVDAACKAPLRSGEGEIREAQFASLANSLEMGEGRDRKFPRQPSVAVLPFVSRRASIAVMPFEAEPSTERALADGLSYDITVGLAKLRSLLVNAQGTTFALRDGGIRGPEAATLLGVNYVATGAVRRDGSRIRIGFHLCDHDSGRLVWTDDHEVRGDDAFQAPGTIAERIVSCLEAEIQLAESNRAIIKPPNSLNAWEAHHRGLWHMYRFTEPDNDEAQRLFRRAIALDPTFSRPYAGLSFTHWQNAFTFRPAERQSEADHAFDAAGRGLQADPRDPAAHWAMGRALWLRKDDAASLKALDDAVALSPSFAMAHYTRGFVDAQTGDAGAAILACDFARQLSPFDPMLYAMYCARAFALARLGRYEEAAEWAARGARKPNAHVQARGASALILAIAGKLDDALRQVGIVRRLRPTYTIEDFFFSYRVVESEERAYRIAARLIGLS
jgi:TolB-like protein/DNA-binding winged helix-turn-helix (wHTH) protein/tetratricopeptide (TPR) repeat protein